MAIIKGDTPIIGERAFLAETATIIGTVTMGDDCNIWYGAGIPARKIKDGSEAIREKANANADHYLMYMKWYE